MSSPLVLLLLLLASELSEAASAAARRKQCLKLRRTRAHGDSNLQSTAQLTPHCNGTKEGA
eukprot:2468362-Rhodomonas_salina.2